MRRIALSTPGDGLRNIPSREDDVCVTTALHTAVEMRSVPFRSFRPADWITTTVPEGRPPIRRPPVVRLAPRRSFRRRSGSPFEPPHPAETTPSRSHVSQPSRSQDPHILQWNCPDSVRTRVRTKSMQEHTPHTLPERHPPRRAPRDPLLGNQRRPSDRDIVTSCGSRRRPDPFSAGGYGNSRELDPSVGA